ncbi:hypothetical protein ACFSE1_11640, partial [Rhizobium helianthi]
SNTKPGEVGKDGKTPDASKLEASPVDKTKADAVAEEASNTKTGAVDKDGREMTVAEALDASKVQLAEANAEAGKETDAAETNPGIGKTRTAGDIDENTVVGYDENNNPITHAQYEASREKNKVLEQPVDSKETTKLVEDIYSKIGKDERVSKEFYSYLFNKYNTPTTHDGTDIYENPQNYTPSEKVQRYVDLLKANGDWKNYQEFMTTPNTGVGGTVKNEREVTKDLEGAMQTLMQDPATASLFASEYLTGVGKILNGERFQSDENGKYDEAYTKSITDIRSSLEADFDANIAKGGVFKDGVERGVNEHTMLQKYNSAMTAYSGLLSKEFLDSRSNEAQTAYNEYYNKNVDPLLPSGADGIRELTYGINKAGMSPEELRRVGMTTPTVDGFEWHNFQQEGIQTKNLDSYFENQKIDSKTQQQFKDMGFSDKVKLDGMTAAYLPTVSNLTNQVFGNSNDKDRSRFAETVMTELQPMISQLNKGFKDGAELDTYVAEVQKRLDGGDMAKYSNEIATSLKGLARGSSLADNMLLQGLGRAVENPKTENPMALKDMQAMLALGTGYEGKSVSGEVGQKVFGVTDRNWDSGMFKEFGRNDLKQYSEKMANDFRTARPGASVTEPTYSLLDKTKKVDQLVLNPLADSMAAGLNLSKPEEIAIFKQNAVQRLSQIWTLAKPGGNTEQMIRQFRDLASVSGGAFNEGSISVSDQGKMISKYGSALIKSSQTYVGAGILNSNDPMAVSYLALNGVYTAGYGAQAANITLKAPDMDFRTLTRLGEHSDAALRAAKQITGKLGGLVGVADIASLPVGVTNFVRGIKSGNFDTAETVFRSFMVGSDVGVAVDGAMNLARAVIPSSVIAGSRFAPLFSGAGGAVMSALGGAANVIGAVAGIGLGIWQQLKAEKQQDRLNSRMDDQLWRLTRNSVSQHIGPWPGAGDPWNSEDMIKRDRENMLYKQDVTPIDWAAIQENNRRRNAQA